MATFREIAAVKLDEYDHSFWQGMPAYQYFTGIESFLNSIFSGKSQIIIAQPKIEKGKGGFQYMYWHAIVQGSPISLAILNSSSDSKQNYVSATTILKNFRTQIEMLKASTDEDEKKWGELLYLCFNQIDTDKLFFDNGKLIIAGWGIVRTAASGTSPVTTTNPLSQLKTSTGRGQISTVKSTDSLNPTQNEDTPQSSEELRETGAGFSGKEQNVTNSPESTIPFDELSRKSQASLSDIPDNNLQELKNDSIHAERNETKRIVNESSETNTGTEKNIERSEEFNSTSTVIPPPKPPEKSSLFGFFSKFWWLFLLLFISLIFLTWKYCSFQPFPDSSTLLPSEPGVIVPIDSSQIVSDEDSVRMIVSDRLNIALVGENKSVREFARIFKTNYPDEKYQIIYFDTLTYRLQIRVPSTERDYLLQEIPQKVKPFDVLIWHEGIFREGRYPTEANFSNASKNWYFDAVKVGGAWDKTFGDTSVVIAVIDDGFDLSHPELLGKAVRPWNVTTRNKNVFTYKQSMHGTHVAGTAVANRDNGSGLAGIAPDCSLMPIQVADNRGIITSTAIIDALLYAINQGADIVNMSLGMQMHPFVAKLPPSIQRDIISNGFKQEEQFWNSLFEYAEKNGTLVVLAAGNDNMLIGVDPMQRSQLTIKVSAINQSLSKANFSNYGELSTISAPGVAINSCLPLNGFGPMDGTSMAAPIVSGAAGLIKTANPKYTPEEIRRVLVSTAQPLPRGMGPLLQVSQALGANPKTENPCPSAQEKIDSLLNEIEKIKSGCPSLSSGVDTMKLPDVIQDLNFTEGRWKSTTSIHNDEGEKVTLYFDFFPNQTGKLTLLEPNGIECKAGLALSFSQSSLFADQIKVAGCNGKAGFYSEYKFSCSADASGKAECIAQNKRVRANRFTFRLVKIR